MVRLKNLGVQITEWHYCVYVHLLYTGPVFCQYTLKHKQLTHDVIL